MKEDNLTKKKTEREGINRRHVVQALVIGSVASGAFFRNVIHAFGQDQSKSSTASQAPDEEYAWVCPMHTDYTSPTPGVCPRCGMTLIRTAPFDVRDYQLDFHTEPALVHAGDKVTLFFRFLRPGTGEVVKKFELVHDKEFHLFVISQDMEHFEHIHPTLHPDGTWTMETVLPKPGYYKVLCDFMPSGGSSQFLAVPLVTANYSGDLVSDEAHLVPDKSSTKSEADITATVSFDPGKFTAPGYGHLKYFLTDTKTTHPIVDLQTYLGAFGHMLIMSEDMEAYVHSHPINMVEQPESEGDPVEYIIPPDADMEKIRGGPTVTFEGLMPKKGNYRAWAQFRRNDQVRTIAYTFSVDQGTAEPVVQ
jgi:Heavy metal binding domain